MANYFNIADNSDDYALALITSYQCRESATAIRHMQSQTSRNQIQRMLLEVAAKRTALTLALTGTSRIDYKVVSRLSLPANEQNISYEDLKERLTKLPEREGLELLSTHDQRVSHHLRNLVRQASALRTARKLSSAIADFQITSDQIRAGLQKLEFSHDRKKQHDP